MAHSKLRQCSFGPELLLGDLHCHFYGTATFSFADGINIGDGDRFQIQSEVFGKPLCNTVRKSNTKFTGIKIL